MTLGADNSREFLVQVFFQTNLFGLRASAKTSKKFRQQNVKNINSSLLFAWFQAVASQEFSPGNVVDT